MRRHYFPTNAVIPQIKEEDERRELCVFPTVAADGQYYLIVFNLLKAKAVILDNEKDKDFDKYKNIFDSVKALVRINHRLSITNGSDTICTPRTRRKPPRRKHEWIS
ncbi:hypothetical protein Tco_0545786 [Tanacetum coccineum]